MSPTQQQNPKSFIKYTSLMDKLNVLNGQSNKEGTNNFANNSQQQALKLSDLRTNSQNSQYQFNQTQPLNLTNKMNQENKENMNLQSSGRFYRPSFISSQGALSQASPIKPGSFISLKPAYNTTQTDQIGSSQFSARNNMNQLNIPQSTHQQQMKMQSQNSALGFNSQSLNMFNMQFSNTNSAQSFLSSNPPLSVNIQGNEQSPISSNMNLMQSSSYNPSYNSQQLQHSPIINNLQVKSKREERKAKVMVESHSQFNSYVHKINEQKLLQQQELFKIEEEKLRQQQRHLMVNSMIKSQQQFLNQHQIQTLFNIEELENAAKSLTPTKDKIFSESAGGSSSVNKYFAKKHNQTLDKINHLKNQKLKDETKECTHQPRINQKSIDMAASKRFRSVSKGSTTREQNLKIQSLMTCLEKDNDRAMEHLTAKVQQERGHTFSPQINEQSKDMRRGVQQLLMWNDIKRVKQSERKHVHDLRETTKKSTFMNNYSKELLKKKNEREIKQLEEERFDNQELDDVFAFSPTTRMLTSPCYDITSSQKPLSLNLNTFTQKGQNMHLISNPSLNKLNCSSSNSHLETLTAYSRSTTTTITSPKMFQRLNNPVIGTQQNSQQIDQSNNQYDTMNYYQPNQQQTIKNQKYLHQQNQFQSSQKKTFDTVKDYEYSRSHQATYDHQERTQNSNFNNQMQQQQHHIDYLQNYNDYENDYGIQNDQIIEEQDESNNQATETQINYDQGFNQQEEELNQNDQSQSHQMQNNSNYNQNNMDQDQQQFYDEDQQDQSSYQNSNNQSQNFIDNQESMQQARVIRERLNQFYLAKMKRESNQQQVQIQQEDSVQNSIQYEEVNESQSQKIGSNVEKEGGPNYSKNISNNINQKSNNQTATAFYGDMSSRTTAIEGQLDSQSFVGGNIMVKGNYKYDQKKDASPKHLALPNSQTNPAQSPGTIQTATASFNQASQDMQMFQSQSQSLNHSQTQLTDGQNSTFTKNLNNISGICGPPQKNIMNLQSNSIFGSSDGLKLSFNQSQSHISNSTTTNLNGALVNGGASTVYLDGQNSLLQQQYKSQSHLINQKSMLLAMTGGSNSNNLSTQSLINKVSADLNQSDINQQEQKKIDSPAIMNQSKVQNQTSSNSMQMPMTQQQQLMQFFVPPGVANNQSSPKPLIASHQEATAKIKQHQQAVAAAQFFSIMMQQTLQHQQNKTNNSSQQSLLSPQQQQQSLLSSPSAYQAPNQNNIQQFNQLQQHQQQQMLMNAMLGNNNLNLQSSSSLDSQSNTNGSINNLVANSLRQVNRLQTPQFNSNQNSIKQDMMQQLMMNQIEPKQSLNQLNVNNSSAQSSSLSSSLMHPQQNTQQTNEEPEVRYHTNNKVKNSINDQSGISNQSSIVYEDRVQQLNHDYYN
eukprot:403337900